MTPKAKETIKQHARKITQQLLQNKNVLVICDNKDLHSEAFYAVCHAIPDERVCDDDFWNFIEIHGKGKIVFAEKDSDELMEILKGNEIIRAYTMHDGIDMLWILETNISRTRNYMKLKETCTPNSEGWFHKLTSGD